MAQSIKLSDKEMDILRKEAALSSRSLAGQAEHWLRIGRAIERSPAFNYQRIRQALTAQLSPDELNGEEQEVFLEEFSDSMWRPSPEMEAFFADRRRRGVGVGLDEKGNLVHQTPEG